MTRLILAAVAVLAASPAVAQEKLTAAQVIARVKENEARYDDLEVRYVRRLRDPDGRPGDQAIHGVRLTDSCWLSPDGSSSPRRATGPWKHVGSCPGSVGLPSSSASGAAPS